jgi:EAL domain-containing protein (putative c-di-GMP-specific phosphodiesterase class I)
MTRDTTEQRTLAALRELGVNLAIDDFGTGYSSLSYLVELPVHILKLDRSFVAELCSGARQAAVARAVVRLAEDLELVVVAEGIEEPEQAQALLELGCRVGQGFLYAKALPEGEFTRGLLG